MLITLIGTGTGVPSPFRNAPCILMRFANKSAIFDSGPGSLKNLLRFGINHLNLDFIFYTHLHLDHISELSSILFAAKIPPEIRDEVIEFRKEIAKLNKEKKLLYRKLSQASQNYLKKEQQYKKKLPLNRKSLINIDDPSKKEQKPNSKKK